MNIEQVNEALVRFDSPPNDLTWENDQAMGQSLGVLADAARRFVAGWETCPTCGGSRLIHDDCRPIGRTMCQTCPDCVDGTIPSPQLVERCAEVLYRQRFPNGIAWGDGISKRGLYIGDATAVLLASRREEQ